MKEMKINFDLADLIPIVFIIMVAVVLCVGQISIDKRNIEEQKTQQLKLQLEIEKEKNKNVENY